MKNKQKTVLLGLSGGVDSAVAALLLKKKGYKVIGAFMRNFSETKNKLTGECSWVEDKKEAQKIAAKLNIPLIILNFENEYKKYVINPMFESYKKGLTPNPDSLCNKIIKFPLLWKEAEKLGADYIATGHYIKRKKTKKGFSLQIPKDKKKDQSYFLYDLTQKDLEHTLFPIDKYSKEQVRKIAKKSRLSNYDKKGTSGICFVGKINMKDFLKQKIKPKKGKLLNPEGKIVGEHNGIMYYTIGERIGERYGIKINKEYSNKLGKKLYIANKKIKKNELIIAPEGHPILEKGNFYIKQINWISEKPKLPLKNIKVKIRHLGDMIPAKIQLKNKKYFCTTTRPIKGLAEGQSAVIYQKKNILGGGEIRFN